MVAFFYERRLKVNGRTELTILVASKMKRKINVACINTELKRSHLVGGFLSYFTENEKLPKEIAEYITKEKIQELRSTYGTDFIPLQVGVNRALLKKAKILIIQKDMSKQDLFRGLYAYYIEHETMPDCTYEYIEIQKRS